MHKAFQSTVTRVNKSISRTPSPQSIPHNTTNVHPSKDKPAPLRSGGCASCGKKR